MGLAVERLPLTLHWKKLYISGRSKDNENLLGIDYGGSHIVALQRSSERRKTKQGEERCLPFPLLTQKIEPQKAVLLLSSLIYKTKSYQYRNKLYLCILIVTSLLSSTKTVNMFKDYRIKLVNDHLVIDDDQHLILDTGSPTSFHSSGVINLSGEDIFVGTSIVGVRSDYLSSNVGTSINGLVGMDIIHRYPLLVDARNGYLFIDDDAVYSRSFKSFDLGPLAQGLIAIEMRVNSIPVRMIVDTGAPVSYIKESILKGLVSEGEVNDFHPYIGDFKTEKYQCIVDDVIDGNQYNQTFGVLPNLLSMALAMLQVDGIIGIDLFKRYRIQIRDGKLFLPPQGI